MFLRIGREGVDHFAGLGVMELLAGFVLNSVGVAFKPVHMLPQVRVLLLQFIDLMRELLLLGALPIPGRKAVSAVDYAPGEGERQRNRKDGTSRTPAVSRPLDGPQTKWKRLSNRPQNWYVSPRQKKRSGCGLAGFSL